MTDTSFLDLHQIDGPAPKTATAQPAPAPKPLGLPVLISDCATPLAGGTVLGLILKRMMRDDR